MTVLYLLEVECPWCEDVVGLVETRASPTPLMQDVVPSARYCPTCGQEVHDWDVREETRVERVPPTAEGGRTA